MEMAGEYVVREFLLSRDRIVIRDGLEGMIRANLRYRIGLKVGPISCTLSAHSGEFRIIIFRCRINQVL